jgi:hypothetical protein
MWRHVVFLALVSGSINTRPSDERSVLVPSRRFSLTFESMLSYDTSTDIPTDEYLQLYGGGSSSQSADDSDTIDYEDYIMNKIVPKLDQGLCRPLTIGLLVTLLAVMIASGVAYFLLLRNGLI